MREFTIDDWTVSPRRNTVARNGIERRLEPRVMDLLVYLAQHAGEVVQRQRIIESVWPHAFVSDSALESAISSLRKALDDDARNPAIIETIPKRGYRLIAKSSAAEPVVAVLPFENLTGSDEAQHFADGLTDALIAELGRHRGLRIISRQSVMAFSHSPLPLPKIADKLNATFIVEGSVLSAPSPVTATVQLINAADDTHLWAETIELEPGRLFAEQPLLAGRIATHLARGRDERRQPTESHSLDPDAMDHYLLGRHHWYKLDPAHLPAALQHFESAIALEPRLAAAYAGVADVWGAFAYWGAMPATAARDRIRDATERALELDPRSAEAHMLAGAYRFYFDHDWQAAQSLLEKAISLNPSLAHARFQLGLVLGTLGDRGAQLPLDSATRLDPLNPAVQFAAAVVAAAENRGRDVALHLARIAELDPAFPPAAELRADLAWLADTADAPDLERAFWHADEELVAELTGRPGAGDRRSLLAAAALLERRTADRYVAPRAIARLYSLAGETDDAFDVLFRAIDAEDLMQLDLLAMMPAFQPLRHDPRFRDVRERLGLPT